MPSPVITLTTDFGLKDEFAGVMKGVILSLCPDARIVDISHLIEPRDVVQAACTLRAAYPYFPKGTVHVGVVDPGVGGARRILAASAGEYLFLAPDNGVLWPILEGLGVDTVVSVTQEAFFLSPVSATFHGRDIFAPVAASLAKGTPLSALGPPVEPGKIKRLEIPTPEQHGKDALSGSIVTVDRFGNLLTNIHREDMVRFAAGRAWRDLRVEIKGRCIQGISRTYSSAGEGALLALFGSRGCLEIAVSSGNAARRLGAGRGDRVRVGFPPATASSSRKRPQGGESDRKGNRL